MKQLYVIDFESANYAGGGEHCLVWAEDEDQARDLADNHMEEYYYEEDIDQLQEENEGEIDGPFATVTKVELLDNSEHKEFAEKESNRQFYPFVN